MAAKKEAELKKIYTKRLREAGYNTVPELVQILPPTIMNIIGSSITTAEKLFISAIMTHMRNVQIHFDGEPPDGVNKALTDLGFMTLQEIADANPNTIAQALQINLENANEIVLHAIELSVKKESNIEIINREELINDIDREISHYLGQLDRVEQEKKLNVLVEETVQKIHETIKLPENEKPITKEQLDKIVKVLEQFITVFPACTGFAIYNRRGEGIYSYSIDKEAKTTLTKIHDSLASIFWKISLVLEEKNEYGWINAQPHLVWIEAIRDRSLKRQLAYIGLFIFESASEEGVGSATLTIKGITKEIERIIYGSVQK